MLSNLLPKQYEKSIFNINLQMLKDNGVKGIITDLDNTLVEWDRPGSTPEVREWFAQIKEYGMLVTIVSNNSSKRVKAFSDPEGIYFIHSARKPRRNAFRQACKQMSLSNKEVVVIGDQIFTDVLGGNRAEMHTILVVPVSKSDGLATKLNRRMERFVLDWMKKRKMFEWEE